MNLSQYEHYHFIGIGGISMSGLAQMLLRRGHTVSGSDRSDSSILGKLRAEGITCFVGHRAEQVEGADAIVYTAAVPQDNCELVRARELGIPTIYRGDLLGAWMRDYGVRVGICGTHGKSSCTSMLATILVEAEKDPSVHIGSELPLISGTTRLGQSEVFITEACEYQDSFLDFFPTVALVLNIEEDHLDYFADLSAIVDSFVKFIRLCPQDGGLAIVNGDDPECILAARRGERETVTFGLGDANDWQAVDLHTVNGLYAFSVLNQGAAVGQVQLSVPGRHHVYNALGAIAAAVACGVEPCDACRFVGHYAGASRRFADAGTCNAARLVHDYAHHPTEIRATLSSARDVSRGKIWCVFQPHTYTRTRALFSQFVEAFGDADHVLLADIYAAREPDPGDMNSRMLADAVTRSGHPDCRYGGAFDTIAETLRREVKEGDLVLILGAGDIIGILPSLQDR